MEDFLGHAVFAVHAVGDINCAVAVGHRAVLVVATWLDADDFVPYRRGFPAIRQLRRIRVRPSRAARQLVDVRRLTDSARRELERLAPAVLNPPPVAVRASRTYWRRC